MAYEAPAPSPPQAPEPADTHPKSWRPSEDDSLVMRHHNISCLFNDAAGYRDAIASCSISSQPAKRKERPRTLDFAELVGQDLNECEAAEAGKFAQITADEWTTSDEEDSQIVYTDEPDSFTDSDESIPSGSSDETAATSTSVTEPPKDAFGSEIAPEAPLHLTSEQIVAILTEEFGALAPEGEERFLFQFDGAVIQDVVILGVIHVTTHRIAFHASMPAFDPNLSKTNDIIKAGPVLIHRKGLHRKRRVWLELSHDFVSSYASAHDEDRIRPIRSIMLSSVLEVFKEDPQHPRIIRSRFDGKSGVKDCYLELDTVESARDWRREIQAALFFSRRRMRKFLTNSDPDDSDGIRIGIPLDCIVDHSRIVHANTLPIVNLVVSTSTVARPSGSVYPDAQEATQTIQFAFHKLDDHWDKVEELFKTSKSKRNSDSQYPHSVVIDCGLGGSGMTPRKNSEQDDIEDTRSKEQVVCDLLAIDYTPDVWITRASWSFGLACIGYLVVSRNWVGFWSKTLTMRDVKYRFQSTTIVKATASDSIIRSLPRHGLTLDLEGHSSLKFQFRSSSVRNETLERINAIVEQHRGRRSPSSPLPPRSSPLAPSRSSSPSTPQSGSRTPHTPQSGSLLMPLSRTFSEVRGAIDPRKVLHFPKAVNIDVGQLWRMPETHFVCLTIGSRGDVQPYIALGLGLKEHGHGVTIVTHAEYKEWIEGFGLRHRSAGGDPGALMKLSVENKMFSPQFFKTSLTDYRAWLDQLLVDAWANCRDAEVLLESPYAMAGVHIAEALEIPYFRVCTMPWTKTAQFPHPFISPPVETPTFNAISYVLFDNVFWTATASQVNRWRRESLKLEPIVMSHVAQSRIPILYNFSPAVVPKPLDWSDSKIICGYWFLDNPDHGWTPPESLLAFMEKARFDKKALVYIGFGSITVPDPRAVTEHIVEAVVKSGVRAIISKGWSSRMSKKVDQEVPIPEECYIIDKIPHDWLFPQVDAALHHGGAGTTGASLRAGIPTLIKPWFGDQYFWASRVQRLGAGMRVSLRVSDLAAALTKATTDRIMKEKAASAGQKIRSEDGVQAAVRAIYTYLPRASSDGLSPE